MDFLDLATKRYSTRKYQDKAVSQDDIDKILLAAKLAPTAHNNQPQEIIVVNSKEGLERLNKCTVCHYNEQLAFIICYNKDKVWQRDYDHKNSGDVDASIVTSSMMFEACELNLGTTWIMYFIPEAIKKEFNIKDNIEPVSLLFVGYPDDKTSTSHYLRNDVSEFVSYQ